MRKLKKRHCAHLLLYIHNLGPDFQLKTPFYLVLALYVCLKQEVKK